MMTEQQPMRVRKPDCNHVWSSNDGTGGEPTFRPGEISPKTPTMWCVCIHCNHRIWVTHAEWVQFTARTKTTHQSIDDI